MNIDICNICRENPAVKDGLERGCWDLNKSLLKIQGKLHAPGCIAVDKSVKNLQYLIIAGNGAVYLNESNTISNAWNYVTEVREELKEKFQMFNLEGDCNGNKSNSRFLKIVSFLENLDKGSLSKIAGERSLEVRLKLSEKFRSKLIIHRLDECNLPQEIWNKSLVICLNWDEALFVSQQLPNVIQLHGRASVPETLIFPGQSHLDRFIPSIQAGDCVKQGCESTWILSKMQLRKMVVWGCSLHDYDSDLWMLFTILLLNTCNKVFPVYVELGGHCTFSVETQLKKYFNNCNVQNRGEFF